MPHILECSSPHDSMKLARAVKVHRQAIWCVTLQCIDPSGHCSEVAST